MVLLASSSVRALLAGLMPSTREPSASWAVPKPVPPICPYFPIAWWQSSDARSARRGSAVARLNRNVGHAATG